VTVIFKMTVTWKLTSTRPPREGQRDLRQADKCKWKGRSISGEDIPCGYDDGGRDRDCEGSL